MGGPTYQAGQDDHVCIYGLGTLLVQSQTPAGLPPLSQGPDPFVRGELVPVKPEEKDIYFCYNKSFYLFEIILVLVE